MVPTFKEKGNLLLGSVVLIKEDNLPRLQWPLARIIDLMPSDDERIRTVRLKTAKGTCVRPVQKLHLLESAKDEALPSDDCQMSPVITKHRKSKTTFGKAFSKVFCETYQRNPCNHTYRSDCTKTRHIWLTANTLVP